MPKLPAGPSPTLEAAPSVGVGDVVGSVSVAAVEAVVLVLLSVTTVGDGLVSSSTGGAVAPPVTSLQKPAAAGRTSSVFQVLDG